MQRLISTLAMTAGFAVLVAGLWQDWGLLTTLKRLVIAYMAFFILGSLMALAVRAVPLFEGGSESDSKRPAKTDGPRGTP